MSGEKHSPEDIALSLTLAIVKSSPAPLLLLDGQLAIIPASISFCSDFGTMRSRIGANHSTPWMRSKFLGQT
jgi:hypothetical protein